jgi:DNA polymerase III epsilon subunit-like protein
VDIEGTGLSRYADEPTEIGGASARWSAATGWEPPDRDQTFRAYTLPGTRRISAEASRITGITLDKLRAANAQSLRVVWTQFVAWVRNQSDPPVQRPSALVTLVTYNGSSYDWPMLLSHLGIEALQELGADCRCVDVMQLARRQLPTLPSHRLATVYHRVIGAPLQHAHSAQHDARATLNVMRARGREWLQKPSDAPPFAAICARVQAQLTAWRKGANRPLVNPLVGNGRSCASVRQGLEATALRKEVPLPAPSTVVCSACRAHYSTYFQHACDDGSCNPQGPGASRVEASSVV